MQVIPVNDQASQTFSVQLAGQSVQLNVYQLSTDGVDSNGQLTTVGLYADVLLNGVPILQGVICRYRNRLIRNAYFGVAGDFCWEDTQGTSDPSTPGLGTRYQLIYLEPGDVLGRGS